MCSSYHVRLQVSHLLLGKCCQILSEESSYNKEKEERIIFCFRKDCLIRAKEKRKQKNILLSFKSVLLVSSSSKIFPESIYF